MSHRHYIERLVITILVLAVALLLWNLRHLLMLVFGAVLVAVVFSIVARPFRERLRLPEQLALLCAVLLVATIVGTAFWLFGAEVARQSKLLGEMVPEAWRAMEVRLDAWGLGDRVREAVDGLGSGNGIVSSIGGFAMSIGAGIANFLLVVVGGIYLASQPQLYRTGLIKLVPPRGRRLAAEALDDSGRALRLWLLGQLVSMSLVGLLTGLGLWLIGVPSALTLGLIAAILEFVPYVGPIAASFPAILLALAESPEMALWTVGLYLVVQQLEGNVIQPLVQQRAVEMPPALLLFALVAGGVIFGIIGVLFAAPLTVVLYVLVKRLYVREALHTSTPLPGEEEGS
jgi:predicted PurR-regulated permease PerM